MLGLAGGVGPSPSAGSGWSCPCCCRERAEGVRDELAGTQRALEVARAQVTAAGSALRSARDAIQVTESRAKEVRDTQVAGVLELGSAANAAGTAGEWGWCFGCAGGNGVSAVGAWGITRLGPWVHWK